MSQAENSKPSPSSSSLGWYIIHKVALLIIIFAAYSYFKVVPEGLIKTAITIGLLSVAASTVMAGKVIDLGLPITCTIGYTVAKLTYSAISGDTPSAYILEISLVIGVLAATLTGHITGKIITRKYIPSYFGSFAVPSVLLYLIYLIFSNNVISFNEFLSSNNMYEISDNTQYIFAGVAFALVLLFSLSKYGKNLRATGSCEDAAIEAGVDTKCSIVAAYTFSGLICGVAGILLVNIPQQAIMPFYFPVLSWIPIVILGAVIGRNKFSGGKFDVLGAALGGMTAVFASFVIMTVTDSIEQASAVILLAILIIVMATTQNKS